MKKNLFLVVGLVVMLSAGLAFGFGGDCQGPCEDQNYVDGSASAQAVDKTFSWDSTFWFGNWNDNAKAKGDVFIYGDAGFTASASGGHHELKWVGPKWYNWDLVYEENPADGEIIMSLHSPEIKSWSYAKDYGLESKAGAGAVIESDRHDGFIKVEAMGLEGCDETAYTNLGVGGNLYQENEAGETGYNDGTSAQGGNSSGLGFYAGKSDSDSGQTYSILGYEFGGAEVYMKGIEGKAITKGSTEVSVDPYGNHRSAYATTSNMSKVNFDNLQESNVWGGGGVGAAAVKGSTFAAGNASFNYNGYTAGNGDATVKAKINTSYNGSSAFVKVEAHAVGN